MKHIKPLAFIASIDHCIMECKGDWVKFLDLYQAEREFFVKGDKSRVEE